MRLTTGLSSMQPTFRSGMAVREASDTRDLGIFARDMHRILSVPDLDVHTRRGTLYKALEDFSKLATYRGGRLWWSRGAHEQWADPDKCERGMYVIEHVLPRSQITKRLAPLNGDAPSISKVDLLGSSRIQVGKLRG